MRKNQGTMMKLIVAKKMKTLKSKHIEQKIARRIKSYERLNCEEFIEEIGENNVIYKKQIINFALQSFLNGKKPINTFFLRYLGNFQKFNASSLLYGAYYLGNSNIVSKGDIRTFIYLYFAFNIISSKYLDDYVRWNKSFIPLWGINLFQASQLEVFALRHIDYNMSIDKEKMEKIIDHVLSLNNDSNSNNFDIYL